MDPEVEYAARLQRVIDCLVESGADEILSEGDEIVLRVGEESVVVSRFNGRLSVRILDESRPEPARFRE